MLGDTLWIWKAAKSAFENASLVSLVGDLKSYSFEKRPEKKKAVQLI